MSLSPIRRALLSVHDKTGIVLLGRSLAAHDVVLVSTGGTARTLREAGLEVVDVSEVTGAPEILDGRVKTLHPKIHGGLLARRDLPRHMATLDEQAIQPIDLLVSSLYPFEATLAAGAGFDDCLEQVDIGGPAMIRAAAKNHGGVAVVTDPADYPLILEALAAGGTTLEQRRRLAAKAFARTAAYDALIAGWLARETGETFPERLTIQGRLRQRLRYGENPHQAAAFYVTGDRRPGVATAEQLQGKELSYNNLLDTDAALELVAGLDRPAIAIIKHTNPCGVAVASGLRAAWDRALACDPVSAFGGIVACNRELDAATAEKIKKLFAEVVIAPAIDADARAVLATKKNLRVLVTGAMPEPAAGDLVVRSLAGGFLAQERDTAQVDGTALEVVTARAPTADERADLLFAWRVVRHVKSNAIVLARGGATVGIGMGQTNRVDSVRIAAERMLKGPGAGPCVVASDAFFPFPDGLVAAAQAGATAAIQPGGSVRDKEVIAAADAAGMAMLFTGIRHFRH
jgi:phosphoribosylaminoimidazolecarboxamide formyltransferase/IMP cyclohydrolase